MAGQKNTVTFPFDFPGPAWNNGTNICYGLGKRGDAAGPYKAAQRRGGVGDAVPHFLFFVSNLRF
jgi:hypothetical protein